MNTRAATLLASLAFATGAVLAGPIHEAAMQGDVAKVKSLLEKDPTLKDIHDIEDHRTIPGACRSRR